MEIRQLKYFIRAAEYLNFTRAAKECGIVQTAMTQQIANLENEIGIRLFDRNRRGLKLTEAGEGFLREARTIVSRAERAVEAARGYAQGRTGLLRIGFHGEMFKRDLALLLREYRGREPQVQVIPSQLSQARVLEGLDAGEIDLGISLYSPHYAMVPGLRNWILETDRLMLAVAKDHPLGGRERVTMKELKDYPVVGFREKSNEERFITLAQAGGRLKNYGYVEDHTSAELLVESGYAAAVWISRLCRRDIYPRLDFLEISDHPSTEQVCASWREDNDNLALSAFLSLLGEHFPREITEKKDEGKKRQDGLR